MFKHKMDLVLKVCTMPFTEFEFYYEDYFDKAQKIRDLKEYRQYYKEKMLSEIYPAIHRRCQVRNLDEVNLLIEKFHARGTLIKSSSICHYYMQLLTRMAKSFICHRNGRIALKYWESEEEEVFIGPYKGLNKIALWNSLNRIFTTDLLVVRYLLDNGMDNPAYLEGYYSTIMMEDLQLEQVLKKGVAETHIHRGAAINFYISWQSLMTLTGSKNDYKKKYENSLFFDTITSQDKQLHLYIQAMAIVRIIMANFLAAYERGEATNFQFYLYLIIQKTLESVEESSEKVQCKAEERISGTQENNLLNYTVHDIIDSIYEGKLLVENEYDFYQIWEDLKLKFLIQRDDIRKDVIHEDVLKYILPDVQGIKTASENIFLFQCMRYLDSSQERGCDATFSQLFFQYIRVKNEYLQSIVQSNLIRGLDHFQKFYDRSTHIQGYETKDYWEVLMRNQFQNPHLKKLEFRCSLGGGSDKEIQNKLKKTLEAFFSAYKRLMEDACEIQPETETKTYRDVPAVGLVFHLIKKKDLREPEKCWQQYCDREKGELYYRELQDEYLRQVKVLHTMRETIPSLSEYIVGLDAASIENNTEPWVFAPVYEQVRDSKTHKTRCLSSRLANRVKSLGFTFHVGEDFRHLLTGLRRIDETIEHFKFHAGDRIGHGIALGLNVDHWIGDNKVVILPRGEYLENLLWIWGVFKDGKYTKCFDSAYLEQEILKYAQAIYWRMEGITVYNLWQAYRQKFKSFAVNEQFVRVTKEKGNDLFCKYVDTSEAMIWNEIKLSHAQHCQVYLERMLEPIQVEIREPEIHMMKHAQQVVLGKISREGIVVETNPTSNVTIGEIADIFSHYGYNLNQRGLRTETSTENTVMISINSDDPSVFNTNVSNEFAYVFYSLLEKGHNREEALQWIDKVRQYGMDSSFIADRALTAKQRFNEVEAILQWLKV